MTRTPSNRNKADEISVLGFAVQRLTKAGFVALAEETIDKGRKALFTTLNAYAAIIAKKTPAFEQHFYEADVTMPDGIGIVFAGLAQGKPLPGRVSGPDFTTAFLTLAEKKGYSVFFLGSTEDNLARIRQNCETRYPNLRIAGTLSPPFAPLDEIENKRITKAINEAKPDALFVGMTAPKQELWLSENFENLNVPFMMGVGAAFDYLAGVKKQVPNLVGQFGGEWLFRLATNPRHMWKRQHTLPYFALLVIAEALLQKVGFASPFEKKSNEWPLKSNAHLNAPSKTSNKRSFKTLVYNPPRIDNPSEKPRESKAHLAAFSEENFEQHGEAMGWKALAALPIFVRPILPAGGIGIFRVNQESKEEIAPPFFIEKRFSFWADNLWQKLEKKAPLALKRDSESLNAHYAQTFDKKITIISYRISNEARGYVVWRIEKRNGMRLLRILDLLAIDAEATGQLLNQAIASAKKQRCLFVLLLATKRNEARSSLQRLHFRPLPPSLAVRFGIIHAKRLDETIPPETFYNLDNWRIGWGDL